jgi:hypothetical protein
VNDALISLIFFPENYHLGDMAILPFLLNSTDGSIMHSAFNVELMGRRSIPPIRFLEDKSQLNSNG